MNNLTLLIPAKQESGSLPIVLKELEKYNLNILISMDQNDTETYEITKKFNCEVLFQKNLGYGSALIEGMNKINTKYLCIFNADGSFDPMELESMYKKLETNNFVFGSRYNKDASSEDDTFLTYVGNKFFSLFGQIFFKLKLNDILYTFIMGETEKFKEIALKEKDFKICVEMPINIELRKFTYTTNSSHERARLKGKKKVNEFKDGSLILICLIKNLLKKFI
tara:strand:- start:89 stop:757 length:669 start_codon:yes stop_codon:yes gene_type:complete